MRERERECVCVCTYLKQEVFLGSKGANLVSDVITDDNDIPSQWILGGQHSHTPHHHPNLREGGGREGGREGGGRKRGREGGRDGKMEGTTK